MSRRNDDNDIDIRVFIGGVLPKLEDYSVLTDQQLDWEIAICKNAIENFEARKHKIGYVLADFQKRLMVAESELERRYLLSDSKPPQEKT